MKKPPGTIAFDGALDLHTVARLWTPTMQQAQAAKGSPLIFDLAQVPSCDTAGATMLEAAETRHGETASLLGANAETLALLELVRRARIAQAAPAARQTTPWPLRAWSGAVHGVAFMGEVAMGVVRAPARHRMFRPIDMLAFTDAAGTQAIPLILLLGFLMGLILAFQSSIPLRRFGAEIFVVNLVAISLIRELGPLLAAVVLAGRTGSAFAAELGTMVVNDEVAAVRTMGIDPMTMLVLPRLAAAMLVMPGLALLLELAGLAGMAAVMRLLGFPLVAVVNQTLHAVRLTDLFGGMAKAMVFGAAVALIGCRSGLGAGQGPRAVGQAATASVVGGIVATIILDGLFTILFFRLGL